LSPCQCPWYWAFHDTARVRRVGSPCVFPQAIPWISSLESQLIDYSSDNRTLTFSNLAWNPDLKATHQVKPVDPTSGSVCRKMKSM
jgi:hypothetical protein